MRIIDDKSTLDDLKSAAFDNLRNMERLEKQQRELLIMIEKKEAEISVPKVKEKVEEDKK